MRRRAVSDGHGNVAVLRRWRDRHCRGAAAPDAAAAARLETRPGAGNRTGDPSGSPKGAAGALPERCRYAGGVAAGEEPAGVYRSPCEVESHCGGCGGAWDGGNSSLVLWRPQAPGDVAFRIRPDHRLQRLRISAVAFGGWTHGDVPARRKSLSHGRTGLCQAASGRPIHAGHPRSASEVQSRVYARRLARRLYSERCPGGLLGVPGLCP